ncbi:MAG: hypothetical protein IT435_06690 [Phycisphaerales bacterium]|nr:hypothetical protein [Phycisphaerales bacterium]
MKPAKSISGVKKRLSQSAPPSGAAMQPSRLIASEARTSGMCGCGADLIRGALMGLTLAEVGRFGVAGCLAALRGGRVEADGRRLAAMARVYRMCGVAGLVFVGATAGVRGN